MKIISETELHLYILNKDLVASEIREEIENQLECNSDLRIELDEIREFFEIFNTLEKSDSKKVFLLTPLILKTNRQEGISLAAQHATPDVSKINYVKTFISAEKYVMVRMFHNPKIKEYEFYVSGIIKSLYSDSTLIKVSGARITILTGV